MAERKINNPQIGDTVTFIKTAAETNNEYLLVEVELAPGGGTGLHYHTTFIEHFEPVKGILGVQVDKEELMVHPGETYTIRKKVIHRFFNPDPLNSITFKVKITPARYFEWTLRVIYGLARDGKVNAKGLPKNIWHLALMLDKGETYIPAIPYFLQRAVFGFLAWIGRMLGKQRELDQYCI
jgi:mannose-6-phosphate isomerase-like protein (cupin superfamily)